MQGTWGSAEIRFDHVALILATFSLLAAISLLVYLVFELAGHVAMQPSMSDIPSGLSALYPF